jgi:hypothetical protein
VEQWGLATKDVFLLCRGFFGMWTLFLQLGDGLSAYMRQFTIPEPQAYLLEDFRAFFEAILFTNQFWLFIFKLENLVILLRNREP